MKKIILLLFVIILIPLACFADWKFNPHTGKLDYYESGVSLTTYRNQSVDVGNNSKVNFISGANIAIVATNSTDGVNYTFSSTASGTGNVSQLGSVNADYFASWDSTGFIKNSTYSATNATNWDSAFGWGDHAAAGYGTSNYTDADTDANTNVTNGATAYSWGNHASAGYANETNFTAHTGNTTIHVTAAEKTKWNNTANNTWVNDTWQADKANYYNKTNIDTHAFIFNVTRNDTDDLSQGSSWVLVTPAEKISWNATGNKTWLNDTWAADKTNYYNKTLTDQYFFNTSRNNTDTITEGTTNKFVTSSEKTNWNASYNHSLAFHDYNATNDTNIKSALSNDFHNIGGTDADWNTTKINNTALLGDVTGTPNATVVGDNSHNHGNTTISGLYANDITETAARVFVTPSEKITWNNTDNKTWVNETSAFGNSTINFTQPRARFIAGENITDIVVENDTTTGFVNITINAKDTTGGAGTYVSFTDNETADINWTYQLNTTKNITAGEFYYGNGSQLDGIPDNATVDGKLAIGGTGAGLTGVANYSVNSVTDDAVSNSSDIKRASLTFTIGDGVSTLFVNATNSTSENPSLPWNFTATEWAIMGDASGSATVKLYKNTTLPVLVAQNVDGTNPINLNSNQRNTSTDLTGWTTVWNAGDILRANLTAFGTVKKITVTIRGYKN
ncbi:MAG: hypothetical protein ABFC84_16635 [Veillonellales bacterium]